MKISLTDQRQMLDLITVSGEKILMQINSSLELYKIETGTYKLHSQECNPEKMIREDINLLSKGMGISPDVVIIRDNSVNIKNSKLTIQTDVLLLDIILMNLLRNAVEASDPGEVLNVTIMEERGECVITIANRRAVPVEDTRSILRKIHHSRKIRRYWPRHLQCVYHDTCYWGGQSQWRLRISLGQR